MDEERKKGYSADGYITHQSHMGEHRYGWFRSDWNGCGWIAVYNLLHSMGLDPEPRRVCAELSRAVPWGGFFGTPVRTVRRFLRRWGVETAVAVWKDQSFEACQRAERGIIRFFDGEYDHYVVFVRTGGCDYRFFNTSDDEPDLTSSMGDYFEKHIKLRYMRAIIPE